MSRTADLVDGITNFFIGLVLAFLGLRFVMRLLGANPENTFVAWWYDVSGQLLEPFRGIFPTEEVDPGFVVEFSTLFAIVAYALIGYLILTLVDALRPAEVNSKSGK